MTDDVPASQRWRGRPVHSLLIQAFVFAVPIIASVLAATFASSVGPRPETLLEFIAWWVVLTAVALGVLIVVDRLARRLLPLAALLKLSMLFPDRAPSRFRIARNAASVRKLQEQLAEARERGIAAEPVWAAETVLTLITALGHHDKRSRGHSERVHIYAELLADELDVDQADRDRLRWAALLHDVGKLVVPAELLNKPGTPDDEEWQALRTHPQAGAELCAPLLAWLGEWGQAIAQHHEWFDGTGYPLGLKGLEISRAARIVAVADCYEVMTTARTYKRALNPAAAREELARCAGTQFDPAIVRAFLNISLGRLRLAMGPLALLSTVPSMARLTSLLEPLARAGAVLGGAALIVGGSSIQSSDATTDPPVETPPAVEVAQIAQDDDEPDARKTPKGTADRAVEAAATSGANTAPDDRAAAAAGPSTPADPASRRDDAQPPRDRKASKGAGDKADEKNDKNDEPRDRKKPKGPQDDKPGPVTAADTDGDKPKGPKPNKPTTPADDRPSPPPNRPQRPENNGNGNGPPADRPPPPPQPEDDEAEDRGADPTPPQEPPGRKEDREDPDTPPANPDPPGKR